MGNARRDGRRRVERLYEVSLGRAVGVDGSKGRRQAHAMAGGTVAASVALVRATIIMMRVRLAIMMMAFGGCMGAVVVIGGQRTYRSLETRIRAAKRHDCCSVRLKRHREHHEPQQDCAKANHRRIVEGRPRVSFALGNVGLETEPVGGSQS